MGDGCHIMDDLEMSTKIAKLIALLSSSHDGEIINAARALGRALKAEGKDWNDLAAAVQRGWPVPATQSPPARPASQQKAASTRTYRDGEYNELKDMVGELSEHARKNRRYMTIKDTNFIDDMKFRFEAYPDPMLTDAQIALIRVMYRRHVEGESKSRFRFS